jgi:hypothetical protein
MAASRVCDGGSGFSAASTAITNTGTATLAAGDEVAVIVIIRDPGVTGTGWTNFGTIASPSTNGGAELLDSIAYSTIRTELWRLQLTATGAGAASWTLSFSGTSNGNTVYAAFSGCDPATPFVWAKSENTTGDTSIETASVDPDGPGCELLVSGAAGGYSVAPSNPSHTAHADLGTALENRTAGTGAASWRTLSLWGRTLPDGSATTAYTITDSQTNTRSHGWQILAQPPTATETLHPDAILEQTNDTKTLANLQRDVP